MKDIIELLHSKETMNLGLSLLCKKYNFKVRDISEFLSHNQKVTFITIIFASLDTDKKTIFKSLNKFKCQIRDTRSMFNGNETGVYVRQSVFPEIELTWTAKN